MTMIALGGLSIAVEALLIDGTAGPVRLDHAQDDGVHRLTVQADSAPESAIGLVLRVRGAARYLRNGYHSWDGSWFTDVGTLDNDEPEGKQPSLGFAMTAMLPRKGSGAVVIGFERHDRFQNRLRFAAEGDDCVIILETLTDGVAATHSETLLIFTDAEPEAALRRWSQAVARASPLPPRLPGRRISGWCSWYNLYAAIDEDIIREHLAAAAAFRDDERVRLDVFQIDDGFTPEMGDWLDVKPQFPRGMAPLIADVAAAGFTPGLWIAPFMVGNRSRLAREHPDWLVRDRATGAPLVQMRFYGEFRWHKRSEEYHILDITHPGAEAWMRRVFRTWAHDWGARYFKVDFMLFGSEHGPDRAIWHDPADRSRIGIWRHMLTIMREEVGDGALILGCGCPLWASVGLVDAVRIGRDVGVKMTGDQSAESLLRDHGTRTHGNGILWQADPDCILLRDRYHDLSNTEVERLAQIAGNVGGVLMTSDHLGDLSAGRRELFAQLLLQAQQMARH